MVYKVVVTLDAEEDLNHFVSYLLYKMLKPPVISWMILKKQKIYWQMLQLA